MSLAPALFFYGTLRHRLLLDIVLGPAGAARLRLSPARLQGHRARWVAGECFPMIVTEPGAVADGVLADGLWPEDLARIAFYEGGHLYAARQVEVETRSGPAAARAFYPAEDAWSAGGPFDLDRWEAQWGAITLRAAADYMAGYGRYSGGEMARRYPRHRARAWSRLIAERAETPGSMRAGPGRAAVEARRERRRHDGFFALDEVALSHPTFAGGRMDVVREVFVGTDAALVLPYDPATGRVVLLEQFRAGPWRRGDARPWVLEPVAGLVDPGESPEDCARREAAEEAGLTLRRLVPVPGGYASPGASTDFFHMFVGLCDLAEAHEGPGGLDAEGEDIRTHVVTLDAALALVETGEVNVLPLTSLLLWTALNRGRLAELA
jgi:ADP-ribose pyrophosphatase